MASLTAKQLTFCQEYLLDLNATQAAVRAGYSADTANEQGSRLLANASVRDEVQRLQEIRAQRTSISADRVLRELAKIAFANPSDVISWGPDGVRLKESDGLDPDVLPAVAEVSETQSEKSHTLRVKMHDKVGALTQLGRHLGLFNDKLKIEHDLSGLTDAELEQMEFLASKVTPKRTA